MSQIKQLSDVQTVKRNAMQSAFESIEARAGEDSRDETKANIAKKLLEELRSSKNLEGKSVYRMEQALAKLEEYFQMETELNMRKGELISIFPDMATKLAANDARYSTSPDDKYKVA